MTDEEFRVAVIDAMERPTTEADERAFGAQCANDLGAIYEHRVRAIIAVFIQESAGS